MSYDLCFFKPDPPRSLALTFEFLNEARIVSPEQQIGARSLAEALLELDIGLVEFPIEVGAIARLRGITLEEAKRELGSITLNMSEEEEDTPLEIEIDKRIVTIRPFYWTDFATPAELLGTYWEPITSVLRRFGLVGFNPQTGANIALS